MFFTKKLFANWGYMNPARYLFAAMLLVTIPSALFADSSALQYESAAQKLTQILLEQKTNTVTIGEFIGTGSASRTATGTRLAFIDAFQRYNDSLRAEHDRFVSIIAATSKHIDGEIQIEDDPNDLGSLEHERFLVVRVTLTLYDGNNELYPLTFFMDRTRDVIETEGLSIAIRDDDARRAHKQIRLVRTDVANQSPLFTKIAATQIRNSAASPYAVELLTKSPLSDTYTARPPSEDAKSIPFVPIGIGEQYALRFHNLSDQEVAIAMKIDGVDQFQFSEDRDPSSGRPKFSHWIVPANSQFTIKGWHITAAQSDNNLASFVVTKYGDGAAQHIIRPADAVDGVITLSVSRSHVAGSGGAKSSAQTGFGPPIKQDQQPVQRNVDPPHEFFAIQYSR